MSEMLLVLAVAGSRRFGFWNVSTNRKCFSLSGLSTDSEWKFPGPSSC